MRGSARRQGRLGHVVVTLLIVCAIVCALHARPVAAAAPVVGGSAAMPSWRVGDVVPLTMYVRVARQVKRGSWVFGRGQDVEDDVVEASEHDGFGNPKEAAEARAKDANGAVEPLEMDEDGILDSLLLDSTGGKHRHQYMRALPPSVGPRFAVDRLTTLRLHSWLSEAARQISGGPVGSGSTPPLQSELALRVSLGRGLRKETTWLPIAIRRAKLKTMNPLVLLGVPVPSSTARPDGGKSSGGAEDDSTILFLVGLSFEFGFQTGVTNTITSYSVKAQYAPIAEYAAIANGRQRGADNAGDEASLKARRLDTLKMHYVWHEHRAYNPARAVTLCSGAALIGAVVVVSVTLNSRSKAAKQFRRRDVAVTTRTD